MMEVKFARARSSMVECVPDKNEVLGSIPSAPTVVEGSWGHPTPRPVE